MILWPAIITVTMSLSSPHVEDTMTRARAEDRAQRVSELAHGFTVAARARGRVLSPREAYVQAEAAQLAEEVEGIPAVWSGGIACVETHFSPWKQSGKTGRGKYCGAMQATRDQYGYSCRELKQARIGYRIGAHHLRVWFKGRRHTRSNLRRALYRYGGVAVNGSTSYPDRVLRCIDLIEDEIAKGRARIRADV